MTIRASSTETTPTDQGFDELLGDSGTGSASCSARFRF